MNRIVPELESKLVNEAMNYAVKIAEIIDRDSRYVPEAYSFVMSSLHSVVNRTKKRRHISGQELLNGIRKYGIRQFGPMARTVLKHWGINKTDDFGEIVFNLIDSGIMKRSEDDSRGDFRDVFDFDSAFDAPFRRSHRPRITSIKKLSKNKKLTDKKID